MPAKNDGGPAFPNFREIDQHGLVHQNDGMSLRDWFAGRAMQALAPGTFEAACEEGQTAAKAAEVVADVAYRMADAMIAARGR